MASLALSRGTLFVGTHAKTARVRAFDLGGRELGQGFTFRDARAGRSAVAGLAVDEDHTVLVADTPADRVRRFSLFGREIGGLGAPFGGPAAARAARSAPDTDGVRGAALPGLVLRPVDVEVRGHREEGWIAIASAGEGRHAVQLFDPDFAYRASCRSLGESWRAFRGVCRLASEGELLYVAESLGRTVQVFRSGEFLFAFQLTDRTGERFEPSALAPAGGGRLVVGCRAPRSALFLVDGSGRPLRELAGEGEVEGSVLEPSDAAYEAGADDRHGRLYVVDRDGLRVQVFTLEGHCLGSFPLVAAPSGGGLRTESGGRTAPGKKGGR